MFAPELTIRYAVSGEEFPRGRYIQEHIIIGTPGKVFVFISSVVFFHSGIIIYG
jgi:hypothetical protein